MFGYVKVSSPELKVREYEFYRGTYCGLCRAMGKCTGQCSRMTLSYDFAFLALVRIALEETPVCFEQKRCLAHPLKKRNSMKQNPTLAYCARAAALLNYHKVMDDLADEKGAKKLKALLARPLVAHARKKAIRAGLAPLEQTVADGLRKLSEIERGESVSVDLPAEAFGEILANIMSFGLNGSAARLANAFGMAVGKWIYMADALDDWEKDAKKNRYNPFLKLYGNRLPTAQELESIRLALKNELYAAQAPLDLMEFRHPDIERIVSNILYLGMPERINAIQLEQDGKATDKNIERTKKNND